MRKYSLFNIETFKKLEPRGLVSYAGTWDADSNIPNLTSGIGVNNSFYVVSSDGATSLDGISFFKKNDIVVFNGINWEKIINPINVGLNPNLKDRQAHTNTQPSSTISDFDSATDARISAQKAISNGLATLDIGGKVPASQLPNTLMEFKGTWNASTNTPTLANGNPPNLPEDAGHVYVCSVGGTVDFGAGNITFAAGDFVILSADLIWEKSVNSNLVSSVNGYQGAVVLAKSDIGLGNVDNTSDANKPVSTATQTALNGKENTITAGNSTQYFRGDKTFQTLNKAAVGLSNVDNTSDATKPLSTAALSANTELRNDLYMPKTVLSPAKCVTPPVLSNGQTSGAAVSVAERIVMLTPFYVNSPVTITSCILRASGSGSASANVEVGFYTNSGSQPASLMTSTSFVLPALAAGATHEQAMTNYTLQRGTYWIAIFNKDPVSLSLAAADPHDFLFGQLVGGSTSVTGTAPRAFNTQIPAGDGQLPTNILLTRNVDMQVATANQTTLRLRVSTPIIYFKYNLA